jgi:hypothetical protein
MATFLPGNTVWSLKGKKAPGSVGFRTENIPGRSIRAARLVTCTVRPKDAVCFALHDIYRINGPFTYIEKEDIM